MSALEMVGGPLDGIVIHDETPGADPSVPIALVFALHEAAIPELRQHGLQVYTFSRRDSAKAVYVHEGGLSEGGGEDGNT